MNTAPKILLALLATLSMPLFADTVFLTNGKTLEGTVVSHDDKTVKLRIKFGVLILAAAKIERVEYDTPEGNAAREKADATEVAAREEVARKNIESGKVLYKGAWVPVAEKTAAERAAKNEKEARDEQTATRTAAPPQPVYQGPVYDSGYGGGFGSGFGYSNFSYGSPLFRSYGYGYSGPTFIVRSGGSFCGQSPYKQYPVR